MNSTNFLAGCCSTLLIFASTHAQASCGQGSSIFITNLPTLGGSFNEPDALNSAGQITGFSYVSGDTAAHVFLYSSNVISDVGTLGGNFGQGFALNNLGDVAGFANTTGDLETHAFLFSSNTMVDLGTLGGGFSVANAVNDSDSVVGNSLTADFTTEAFLYANGSMTSLGTLGGDFSSAIVINQAGIIAGDSYTTNDFEYHSFIYSNATMVDLGTLGGGYSSTFDINEAGTVVGESSLNNGDIHAFVFSNGFMADAGTLGGTFSSASAVNDANQAVGIAAITNDAETHAFIYDGATMTDLGTFGGTYSEADAINNSGQVVGYATLANGSPRAFVWQSGTLTDLNSLLPVNSGWELQIAKFINDSGRIVGQGIHNGSYEWFVLDLATSDNPPVAVAGPDQTAECQVAVTLDGSQSSDPDGGALTFAWSENGVVLGTNSTFTAAFDVGVHVITLTVTDPCGSSATSTVTVTVSDNTPPVITSAPAPITAPSDAHCQAIVPDVLGSIVANDNCAAANQLVLDQSPAAGTLLGDGHYSIVVTVRDLSGNTATTNISFDVVDATAPVIQSVTADPGVLTSPNHQIVPVTVSVTASDSCDAAPVNKIISITANETVVTGDIQITGDLTANLAASRNPSGGGRIYTITVQSTDAAGNSSTATTTVTVTQGNGKANGKSKTKP